MVHVKFSVREDYDDQSLHCLDSAHPAARSYFSPNLSETQNRVPVKGKMFDVDL